MLSRFFEPRHAPEELAGPIDLKFGMDGPWVQQFGPTEANFEIQPMS